MPRTIRAIAVFRGSNVCASDAYAQGARDLDAALSLRLLIRRDDERVRSRPSSRSLARATSERR